MLWRLRCQSLDYYCIRPFILHQCRNVRIDEIWQGPNYSHWCHFGLKSGVPHLSPLPCLLHFPSLAPFLTLSSSTSLATESWERCNRLVVPQLWQLVKSGDTVPPTPKCTGTHKMTPMTTSEIIWTCWRRLIFVFVYVAVFWHTSRDLKRTITIFVLKVTMCPRYPFIRCEFE